MKFIRLLGAVVIFYGLSYLLYGVLQAIAFMRQPAGRRPMTAIVLLNLVIGVSTLIIGMGLLMAKVWARVAWPPIAVVLVALHVFLLLFFYLIEAPLTQQFINVFLITFLVVISWSKLTDDSVKASFK